LPFALPAERAVFGQLVAIITKDVAIFIAVAVLEIIAVEVLIVTVIFRAEQ